MATFEKFKNYVELKQRFKTPILVIPLLETKPKGLDKLRELGRTVFCS